MTLPKKIVLWVLAWASVVCGPGSPAAAQDWTRFRGPNGDGHGKADGLPAKWTDADWLWKARLPGTGHGSPVVWGDRIFLLACDAKAATRSVVCVSAADG